MSLVPYYTNTFDQVRYPRWLGSVLQIHREQVKLMIDSLAAGDLAMWLAGALSEARYEIMWLDFPDDLVDECLNALQRAGLEIQNTEGE